MTEDFLLGALFGMCVMQFIYIWVNEYKNRGKR